MSTITQSQSAHNNLGITPYGNLTALHFVLETNATGAAINSSSTAAIAIGDVVRLGVLPAGFKLIDSQVVVQTGLTASVTGKLGFAYVDGVDVVGVAAQDDDSFEHWLGAQCCRPPAQCHKQQRRDTPQRCLPDADHGGRCQR